MTYFEIKCTNKYCAKSGRCWRFNAPDNGKKQLYDFYEPYVVTDKHETTQCAWYETPTTTKKRGGPQPGSGRPPKDPADTVVKCRISMTQAHHAATEGDRSGMIRRALDWYLYFKDKPPMPDTTTITVTTSSEASEPTNFTVKGYEDINPPSGDKQDKK